MEHETKEQTQTPIDNNAGNCLESGNSNKNQSEPEITDGELSQSEPEITEFVLSLNNISYKLKYVPVKALTIGATVISAKIITDTYKKNHNLSAVKNNAFFDNCSKLFEEIDNLYRDSVSISSSSEYSDFIKKIFEDDYTKRNLVKEETFKKFNCNFENKYALKCSLVEIYTHLFEKIRMWSITLEENGFGGLFNEDQKKLSGLFKSFLSKYKVNANTGKKITYVKNKETEKQEEVLIDVTTYSEAWIDHLKNYIRYIDQYENNQKSLMQNTNANDKHDKGSSTGTGSGKNTKSKKTK